MFKKVTIISNNELIKKDTEVRIIGTIGDRKYEVRDNNGIQYTVMKDSVDVVKEYSVSNE